MGGEGAGSGGTALKEGRGDLPPLGAATTSVTVSGEGGGSGGTTLGGGGGRIRCPSVRLQPRRWWAAREQRIWRCQPRCGGRFLPPRAVTDLARVTVMAGAAAWCSADANDGAGGRVRVWLLFLKSYFFHDFLFLHAVLISTRMRKSVFCMHGKITIFTALLVQTAGPTAWKD